MYAVCPNYRVSKKKDQKAPTWVMQMRLKKLRSPGASDSAGSRNTESRDFTLDDLAYRRDLAMHATLAISSFAASVSSSTSSGTNCIAAGTAAVDISYSKNLSKHM
jgi:hypothetical protein